MGFTVDDTITQITLFSKVCSSCVHFNVYSPLQERKTCRAFPDGIPPEIWTGETGHDQPFPGDRGIRYKRRESW